MSRCGSIRSAARASGKAEAVARSLRDGVNVRAARPRSWRRRPWTAWPWPVRTLPDAATSACAIRASRVLAARHRLAISRGGISEHNSAALFFVRLSPFGFLHVGDQDGRRRRGQRIGREPGRQSAAAVTVAGTLRARRHDMDDAEAARLQLLENERQRVHRPLMDVVQQQDALALGFEPLHARGAPPRAGRACASRRPARRRPRPSGRARRRVHGPAAVWPKPGKRKNGATLPASPSAAAVAAMPSSIWALPRSTDSARKRIGWLMLWVPTVWPSS